MRVGTKSVLFGAHCFFLHPFFVAVAWSNLYGFPWDMRLWFAFFLHDIGYFGKPNMDGPEGERHPEVGAAIMRFLFGEEWANLCLFHSRYYAKAKGAKPSRLCFADKLAFPLTPRWLYLPMVTATGEIVEYLKNAHNDQHSAAGRAKREWHEHLCEYMVKWVEEHKSGAEDTWTSAN